jgi:hypothetical protein
MGQPTPAVNKLLGVINCYTAGQVRLMKWFYEIRGSNDRLMEASRAKFDTEKEALAAGGERAKKIVISVGAPRRHEMLSVIATENSRCLR